MAFALCRVDDRLVHGQVVIGWGRPLAARLIILVDDAVRHSTWEQDLYRMAAPEGVEVVFADVAEGIAHLQEWADDPRPGILLTGDIGTMAALHDAAPALMRHINLGGLHHRPERSERLRYIYLGPEDETALRRLQADGAEISAQDLPTSPAVGLEALLR